MNFALILDKSIKEFLGIQPINEKIGQQFFNKVIVANLNHGSQVEPKLQSPGYDVWVTQITTELYVNGTKVNYNGSGLDKVTIQIEDTSQSDMIFADSNISIYELNALGQSDNFPQFRLYGSSLLKISIAHSEQNWTTGSLEARIVFSGFKMKKG